MAPGGRPGAANALAAQRRVGRGLGCAAVRWHRQPFRKVACLPNGHPMDFHGSAVILSHAHDVQG
jgi:hypothetical protein